MSIEQKFTLSADTVVEWIGKLKKSGQLPLPVLGMLAFVEQLRGKRLEIIVRVAEADKPPR